MGAFTDFDVDTFMPRPNTGGSPSTNWEALTWISFGSSTFATGGGAHAGERVMVPTNAVQTFTGTAYGLQGMECQGLLGGASVPQNVLKFMTSGVSIISTLACTINGALQLYNGNTLVAATANGFVNNTNYYTIEFAWGNVTPPVSEVRVNGVRVPELTTANFTATGGQPAGTLVQDVGHTMNAPQTAGTIARVILGDTSGGTTTSGVYWWYRKNGAALWVTVSTGSTFATTTDFEGPSIRIWRYPLAVGNYPLVRWSNSAGTHPTNIADNPNGTDGDTTAIQNGTAGTGTAADKISHTYATLPPGTTRVGIFRRTVIAKLTGGTSTIRSGRRVGGVDTPDTAVALGAGYAALKTPYPCQPDGTTVTTPTLANALEGYIEQQALT